MLQKIDTQIGIVARLRATRHIAYWSSIVIFFGVFWGSDGGYYGHFIVSELILLPPKMLGVYTILRIALPKFLLRQRFLYFGFTVILVELLVSITLRISAIYIINPLYGHYNTTENIFNIYRIVQFAADFNTVLILPLGYTLFREWYGKQLETKELNQQRTQAELQLLRHQIHPHFLFNSLNNLYSLALKKSEKTPEAILQLAALMRYQLHDATAAYVPISKEINYIRNYIEVEKLRYSQHNEISFTQIGDTETSQIAPLILLPFVENAFKHGLSAATETAWFRIEIGVHNGTMHFIAENSKPSIPGNSPQSGIGLANLRKRLSLIYPDRHKLQITNTPEQFLVSLQIELYARTKNKNKDKEL